MLGDSVAYGFGDSRYNNNGGYALRLAKKLKFATVTNLAEPGLRSFELVAALRSGFKNTEQNAMVITLRSADIVILDLGRNDRWLFGEPKATYANLKTARSLIVRNVQKLEKSAPLVVIATMMLPNRGSQGPWMKALNSLILAGNTLKYPSDLRFDLVSKRLLCADQIHPTSLGYDALARTLYDYIKKVLPRRMLKLRPDNDKDGVFDLFETIRYGTNPELLDTDQDGKSDGQEIFVSHTDPLVAD